MKMKLKNNKKGFTLIEIIVVLIIMGILIALAVPAVLGYVNQAKESQAMMEGRAGYLGAQTILVTKKATLPKDELTKDNLQTAVNDKDNMVKALGVDAETIKEHYCEVTNTATAPFELAGCSFQTKSTGTEKWVNVTANSDTTVDEEAKYKKV